MPQSSSPELIDDETTCPSSATLRIANGTSHKLDQAVLDSIAESLRVPVEQLSLSLSLAELKVDSLQAIELISELEQAFAIEVSDGELAQLHCIGDVLNLVHSALMRRGDKATP